MRCNYFYVEKSDTAERKLFFIDYRLIILTLTYFFFRIECVGSLTDRCFILFFRFAAGKLMNFFAISLMIKRSSGEHQLSAFRGATRSLGGDW